MCAEAGFDISCGGPGGMAARLFERGRGSLGWWFPLERTSAFTTSTTTTTTTTTALPLALSLGSHCRSGVLLLFSFFSRCCAALAFSWCVGLLLLPPWLSWPPLGLSSFFLPGMSPWWARLPFRATVAPEGCNASVLLLPPAFPLDCNPVCRRLLCCLVWFELYIMYVTKT